MKSVAAVPDGAIPFIFDRHLYLQVTLNDSIPVTVVYDTGADFLYLDKDFLEAQRSSRRFRKKGQGKNGRGGKQRTPNSRRSLSTRSGSVAEQWNIKTRLPPIIALRDILGRHTDGLLGNTHLLRSPLEINFSEGYMLPLKAPVPTERLADYVKLEARFENNRIDVRARLQIDDKKYAGGMVQNGFGDAAPPLFSQMKQPRHSIWESCPKPVSALKPEESGAARTKLRYGRQNSAWPIRSGTS